MKAKFILLILVLVIFTSKSVFSQYIQGTVIDKSTLNPLSGASIKFQNRGLISNSKGEFRFNIPEKLRSSTPLKV